MNIYLGGPMTNRPHFNTPNFRLATAKLEADGHTVFSPVKDNDENFGSDWSEGCPTGTPAEAEAFGFVLREAFLKDLTHVCLDADAIALLPGWKDSKGARAEYAVAVALGLNVIELVG